MNAHGGKQLQYGLIGAAALFMAGCASDSGVEEVDANGTEGSPGGDLILAVLSDANTLDPHTGNDVPSGNIQTNVYETLTKFNEDMELEPLLAESWEAIEDDVWEFKLNEGITFHDDSEFNADVVKANLERILDEEVASPRKILFEIIEEIEVVDDHTIHLSTEVPFAPLPAHFAHYAAGIVSQDVIEEDYANMEAGGQPGEYINENPIGTGYFTFNSWAPGDQIVLDQNPDYWGEPALVDTVTFRVVPEDQTRLADLETGAAHIISPITASDFGRLNNTDGINAYERNAASITYLGFNMQKEPFDDVNVRKAVAMTINKEDMMNGILEGTGEVAVGTVNDTNFGYSENVTGIERDPERARELLAEAGYEDGFSTTIWTNDNRERMDIAEMAQQNLEEIGIDVEIRVVEWGAYLDATASGEHDMFILGLSLGTGDADYPMHMLFHSDNIGPPGNRVFMEDDTFDDMLHQARIEQDENTRLGLYEDASNYLNEEVPMTFLYHPSHIMGYRDGVEGFWADASGFYQLNEVTIP
ncbi:glutathione ABC transporter substrate-binding protein [Alkalicoccobacillus porphyridii]|uniref:Glutathione ABC transporter substrate-binding protein n=1 Tax=Alkalicoccobacillus porphyridii TaxID=2597270 RepID=A0A554A0P5_9BACI|nr:glutathione ABC transporter substrate-binding protein [Alkalicoccobacillus porphyridii]TSB47258.1 glutathione ABC transporter substrate-binding protein [Alkalicoccobacillus porphyridii]